MKAKACDPTIEWDLSGRSESPSMPRAVTALNSQMSRRFAPVAQEVRGPYGLPGAILSRRRSDEVALVR